jgi:two-component system sensor histidine kinase YesM
MFKSLSYQKKIFLSLSLSLFVVFSLINVFFYYRMESIIGSNVAQNKQQTTLKLQEQVDRMLIEMDKLSISINASDRIMNVLRMIPNDPINNYFDEHSELSGDIRNTLLSFTSLQPLKGRISIISLYGDYLGVSNKMDSRNVDKNYIREMPEVQKYMNMKSFKQFLPPHPDEWSEAGDTVISLVRPLRDNYHVYGLVEISYNIKELEDIFYFKNSLTTGNVAINNSQQQVLFSTLNPNWHLSSEQVAQIKLSSDFGHMEWKADSNSYMVFYSKLATTDWNILVIEDMNIYSKPVKYLRNSTLAVYFALLIVLLLILYLYTGRVTRPLRRLKDSLANVDMSSLELLPARLQTKNEITLLGVAFQQLLDELKETMQKAEYSYQREMMARMNALQAQVNPHFLYNTLTVIGAYGKSKGNGEVMEMCTALSDMMRYTMKFEQNESNIHFEVEHMRNYLELMSKRYQGFVEYKISMDPSMNVIPMPKLILQPIVENAFQHGVTAVDPPWIIHIEGIIIDSKWNIRIRDNGKGFEPDTLLRLRHEVEWIQNTEGSETLGNTDMNPSVGNGIGLLNVFTRLVLYYGTRIQIEISNHPDGGAEIMIGGDIYA